MDVGDFQRFIFDRVAVAMLLAFDELDESDVLGELCDIVGLEEDDDAVFGTLQAVLVLVFDEEGVEAALAVGVATGCE